MADIDELPRGFGPYVLIDHVGRGGMGDVYVARHGALAGFEKHCVLKMLRSDHVDDPDALARFSHEARLVVQLSHRNICPVFDVGRVGSRLYVAMEHIVGRDLRALSAAGPVPLAVALHIVDEVLEALDHAHRAVDVHSGAPLGIVHRDVSPQNVLVGVDGDTRLIDFGIATTTLATQTEPTDTVLGKLSFMSPEHARGHAVDGRSDQFAVALVLAELVAGRPFHAGRSPRDIWETAGLGTFRPPWWDGVTPGLRALLDRALSPSPADRFATCGDFAEALTGWSRAHGEVAGPRDVRAHLRRMFGDLAAEHRKRLRRFVAVTPPPANAPARGGDVGFESIATTLAQPVTSGFGPAVETLLVRPDVRTHPSPPTATATAPPTATAPLTASSLPSASLSPSRPLLLGLAVAAALVLGWTARGFVIANAPTPVPIAVAPAAASLIVAAPIVAAPIVAAPIVAAPIVAAPIVAVPSAAAVAAPVVEVELAPITTTAPANVKSAKATSTSATSAANASSLTPTPPLGPTTPLPPATTVEPALRPRTGHFDAETREGLSYLAGCVDKVACARGLLQLSKESLSPQHRAELKSAVTDCRQRCRLRR